MNEPDASPTAAPMLRVVSGAPTAEELAVLTAVVSAVGADNGVPVERVRRGGWSDPAASHRRQLAPGPNGWRAAQR